MGQYGALGYASAPYNWNAAQILSHYYGGTSLAGASEGPINVQLSELAGAGAIKVTAQDANQLYDNGVKKAGGVFARAAGDQVFSVSAGDIAVYYPGWANGYRLFKGEVVLKGTSNLFGQEGETWNVVALEDYVDGVVPASHRPAGPWPRWKLRRWRPVRTPWPT